MCSLCGTLGSAAHWSEGGGDRTQVGARREVLRERIRRVALLNRVLAPSRMHVDEWEETAYILRGPTGQSVLCGDLAAVFAEVQRLRGAPLDPLDPTLVEALSA
ncbi:MAG: hypothetical protein ACR2J9_04845 [Gaiellales bacterium]